MAYRHGWISGSKSTACVHLFWYYTCLRPQWWKQFPESPITNGDDDDGEDSDYQVDSDIEEDSDDEVDLDDDEDLDDKEGLDDEEGLND